MPRISDHHSVARRPKEIRCWNAVLAPSVMVSIIVLMWGLISASLGVISSMVISILLIGIAEFLVMKGIPRANSLGGNWPRKLNRRIGILTASSAVLTIAMIWNLMIS